MRLAQPARDRLAREPLALLGEPEQARAKKQLHSLAREAPLAQLVQGQRELRGRSGKGRASPALAPGNPEPVEGGAELLGDSAAQAARCDGDGLRGGACREQVGARAGHLAGLRGRGGTGAQRQRSIARPGAGPEQPGEERRRRRPLGRVMELHFGSGLSASQRLEGP